MSLRFTEEDLKKAGYVEVEPGVFKRLTPEQAKKESKKPEHLKHIKTPKLTFGERTFTFRSGWEADYARYCEFLKRSKQIKDWDYECQRFDFPVKRGSNSYLPDFKVLELDGSHCWKEVKGYLDQKGATKLKRMAKYFPNEKVDLVRAEEIQEIRRSGVLELIKCESF